MSSEPYKLNKDIYSSRMYNLGSKPNEAGGEPMSSLDMFSLKGKIALVTGGASGIGFDMAMGLARAGAVICINGRTKAKIDHAVELFNNEGLECHGYIADVSKEDDVAHLVETIEKEVGVIDILVNNAGVIKRQDMTQMSAADFRQVIDIDLVGPFLMSKAVIPHMIQKGHGKIINICSMMSEVGRETVSAYTSAKGGLKMLTKNICSEYGGENIQCNGIGPGYIETEMTSPLTKRNPDGTRQPFDAFIISKTPAGRWGKPEDLIGPAVFLASDASNFVNGQILYVDGGILAYLGRMPEQGA